MLTRLVLVAAAAGIAGVLLWGYIANRYMADFMPFLILAGAIGMIELWRRILHRGRRWHELALGGITVLAAFGLVANIGIALEPTAQFNNSQLTAYIRAAAVAQRAIVGVNRPPRLHPALLGTCR